MAQIWVWVFGDPLNHSLGFSHGEVQLVLGDSETEYPSFDIGGQMVTSTLISS